MSIIHNAKKIVMGDVCIRNRKSRFFLQNRKNRNLDFMHIFCVNFSFDHINPITANSGKFAYMCEQ